MWQQQQGGRPIIVHQGSKPMLQVMHCTGPDRLCASPVDQKFPAESFHFPQVHGVSLSEGVGQGIMQILAEVQQRLPVRLAQ